MSNELAVITPAPPSDAAPDVPRPSDAADLFASWLAGRKPSTVVGYRGDVELFARFLRARLGAEGPAARAFDLFLSLDVGPANGAVLDWRNEQLAAGLSSATVSRRMASVRSLVRLARTLGRVAWSIEVDAPRAEARRDMRGPDRAGMARVRRALKALGDGPEGRRTRAVVALLFGLGLRRAEAVAIELADVDFPGATLRVLGKGRREKVTLQLDPKIVKALGDWVTARGRHDGPLFCRLDRPGPHAAPLGVRAVNRLVDRLAKAAGLAGKLRPHGFRHAAITDLFRRDETVAAVMSFSRHLRPETVMRYHDELHDDAPRLGRLVAEGLD